MVLTLYKRSWLVCGVPHDVVIIVIIINITITIIITIIIIIIVFGWRLPASM